MRGTAGRFLQWISPISLWHVLAVSLLFVSVTMVFSRRIIRRETHAATTRLQSFTAGASRHLESQFDGLRDDFRLLASLDAFASYFGNDGLPDLGHRNQAMVRRFFARHQDSLERIEVELRSGKTMAIEILPGNYLSVSELPSGGSKHPPRRSSSVSRRGDFIVISEWLPAGVHSPVAGAELVIRHRDFLGAGLESYMMGQSELWIWALDANSRPDLIRHPLDPRRSAFQVSPGCLRHFKRLMNDGLEGMREHTVAFPDEREVISVFNPLSLAGEPLGLVFSTEKDRHLASLHRLSGFMLMVFSGGVLLLGAWFGFSYLQIRRSEAVEVAARKDAEMATRVKSDFVAAMSHEIRTPLHGILGYAELLRQSGLSEEQERHISIVKRCGDHLLTLLNDILDFSRLEAGAATLRRDEFSPEDVAREVIDLLSTAAGTKGLALDCSVDRNVPARVTGDAGRVRQVLFNLVGNAIKFTPSGGVTVHVGATAGSVIRFEVTDTGIGIDSGAKELLFQPFSQLDRSSSRSFEGTGLGLAICRRLVDQMGGRIDFDSRPGSGSTFFFEIDLPAANGAADFAETGSEAAGELRPLQGAVLIVDDNEVNRSLLSALFKRRGLRVMEAGSGADALEMIGGEDCSLILMDVEMPGMDGLETTRRIREAEGGREGGRRVIVGLSAHAFNEDREAALVAGMDDYLTKSLTLGELDRVIARHVA